MDKQDLRKALMNHSRADLDTALIDCFYEDPSAWHTKGDLVSDIIAFGYAETVLGFLKS